MAERLQAGGLRFTADAITHFEHRLGNRKSRIENRKFAGPVITARG
jgi:hypothetical protein